MSGAWMVKSRVVRVTDLAVAGVVQLTSSGWLAGTVAFSAGALMA